MNGYSECCKWWRWSGTRFGIDAVPSRRPMPRKPAAGLWTLDALHVASALVLGAREFITSDQRQTALAAQAGLPVTDPTRQGP